MADLADFAASVIEDSLAQTLMHAQKFDAVSEHECEECGDEIPEQRRKLGGVTLCVTCQSVLEMKRKQHRGYL
ncbi:TraR/DksA C4-type zinc finger protein [Acinetobacter sp. ANC 5502]